MNHFWFDPKNSLCRPCDPQLPYLYFNHPRFLGSFRKPVAENTMRDMYRGITQGCVDEYDIRTEGILLEIRGDDLILRTPNLATLSGCQEGSIYHLDIEWPEGPEDDPIHHTLNIKKKAIKAGIFAWLAQRGESNHE